MNSTNLYIYISCGKVLPFVGFTPVTHFSWELASSCVVRKNGKFILDHFLHIIFDFTDFYGISSALSFTGCMILIVPCTGIVPWLAALRGLEKVTGNKPKVCGDQAGDNSSMCLPDLFSLIAPFTTQAFPNPEKISITLLSCFLNAVTLHHAQHPLAAKFLTSFASPLKGHLLCLVLNLHLVAWLVPQPLVLKKSLEGKFQFIFSGLLRAL